MQKIEIILMQVCFSFGKSREKILRSKSLGIQFLNLVMKFLDVLLKQSDLLKFLQVWIMRSCRDQRNCFKLDVLTGFISFDQISYYRNSFAFFDPWLDSTLHFYFYSKQKNVSVWKGTGFQDV